VFRHCEGKDSKETIRRTYDDIKHSESCEDHLLGKNVAIDETKLFN